MRVMKEGKNPVYKIKGSGRELKLCSVVQYFGNEKHSPKR